MFLLNYKQYKMFWESKNELAKSLQKENQDILNFPTQWMKFFHFTRITITFYYIMRNFKSYVPCTK